MKEKFEENILNWATDIKDKSSFGEGNGSLVETGESNLNSA